MKMKKILMLACAVLMVSVATAQKPAKQGGNKAATEQKKPVLSFTTMADQALAQNLITQEQRDQLVEINKKANNQKTEVNKTDQTADEKKAAIKKIDAAKAAEYKVLLGDKYADFAKFRDDYFKQGAK